MRTIGISPKVAYPTLAAVAVGTALVVLGVLLHDGTVRDTGIGVLATAGVVIAPVGYSSPPGPVAPTPESQVKAATSVGERVGP